LLQNQKLIVQKEKEIAMRD